MNNFKQKLPPPGQRLCPFCANKVDGIDYKNLPLIRPFVNYYAKIKQRYYTGVCLKHQKRLSSAIKKARVMALLPFTNG